MLNQMKRRKLWLALALAALVRLAALLAFPSIFDFSAPDAVIHGSEAYDAYALNLLETGVYGRAAGVPDSTLPPLYSYALALVYGVFERNYLVVGLVHIAFDLISIALLYDIARRLFEKGAFAAHAEWIGTLSALFFALYPYLIFQNLTLNDTALWILLLHLFVWLMILLRERENFDTHTLQLAVAGGAILGLSALTRALLPPLALLVVLWFKFHLNWRQTISRLLPVVVVSFVALLPWLIRGYQIHGGWVAVALNGGENLYQGANPGAIPIFRAGYDAQWSARPPDAPATDDPYRNNQLLMEAGLRYLRENPAVIPELLWVKLQVYWNPQVTPLNNLREGERLEVSPAGEVQIIRGQGSHTGASAALTVYQDEGLFNRFGRGIHIVYFGGLWLLAIAGAWQSRREWRELSLLVFVQLSHTAVYLVFHPSTRYRSPTDPLLFVFSALTLVWIWRWWRGRTNPTPNPLPEASGRGRR